MQKTIAEHEMSAEAAAFAASLTPGAAATIVTLAGDLGAGKTTFAKGVARALGIEERVTSPTFVIMKVYDLEGQPFSKLVHMDAYRLKGKQHLKVLGWDDLLQDPQTLVLVEWPEKIAGAIPRGAHALTFQYSEDGKRHISYGKTE